VLDAKSHEWVQTGIFTSINESRAVTMPVTFNLPRPTKVTVILANYTAHDRVSRWRLTTVSINGRSRAGRSLVHRSAHGARERSLLGAAANVRSSSQVGNIVR
jgi:hypothetical protein